jgi:hypothetical protein
MLVYSKTISSRLEYACEVLLSPWYPELRISSNIEECERYSGPVLCYDYEKKLSSALWIHPHGLLFEKSISHIEPNLGEWSGLPTLFPVNSDLPFDILSAVFFLVSRYEEYNREEGRDDMGRFLASSSVAFVNDFLHRPLIDEWRKQLSNELEIKWPGHVKITEFKEIISIDVDSAFAYKHKGFKRTLGGFGLDVIKFRFRNFTRRFSTLLGWRPDDFNTYDQIMDFQKVHGVPVIWFFLLSDYNKYDINVPHTSKPLRTLISKLDGKTQVGIHPGVMTNDQPDRLKTEIERLVEITRRPCMHSRQHYLVLRFPDTYRNLFASGIRHDYTMGYADQAGFRASTSLSFRWYDLEKDAVTNLFVHPFVYMDITLRHYLNLSPEQSLQKIEEFRDRVRTTGGTFISLWHNETFSNLGKWRNWKVSPIQLSKDGEK